MKNNYDETFSIFKDEFKYKSDLEIYSFLDTCFSISEILEYGYTKQCNEGNNDERDHYISIMELCFIKICKVFGVEGFINTDPRGCALKFKFPSGKSNSMFENRWNIVNDIDLSNV